MNKGWYLHLDLGIDLSQEPFPQIYTLVYEVKVGDRKLPWDGEDPPPVNRRRMGIYGYEVDGKWCPSPDAARHAALDVMISGYLSKK